MSHDHVRDGAASSAVMSLPSRAPGASPIMAREAARLAMRAQTARRRQASDTAPSVPDARCARLPGMNKGVPAVPRSRSSARIAYTASPPGAAMRPALLPIVALPLVFVAGLASATPHFEVVFEAKASARPLDGRLLLILSNDPGDEPRNQVNDTAKTQQMFGVDVDGWKPGDRRVIDASVLGYPRDSLRDLP